MKTAKTKVVFRKDRMKNGEVFALFPELPGTHNVATCLGYAHVGQHFNAEYASCIWSSRPATPEEYGPLKSELERIGYVLAIRKKESRAMRDTREAAAKPSA